MLNLAINTPGIHKFQSYLWTPTSTPLHPIFHTPNNPSPLYVNIHLYIFGQFEVYFSLEVVLTRDATINKQMPFVGHVSNFKN
jgi:hypothetical protein